MTTAEADVASTLARAAPRRRGWIVAGVALGIVGISGVFLATRGGGDGPAYRTDVVAPGELVVTVTATGTLRAVGTVEVGAEVSGRLASVDADYNDAVHAGDVLARIDTEQLQAAVDQATAQVQVADAAVAQAKATWREARAAADRVSVQSRDGLVSVQQVESASAAADRARAALASAEANRLLARASLDAACSKLQKASIVAPIDGVVLRRYVEPGQTVTAGFTTPVLFKLAKDLDAMEIVVAIDEADVGRVHPGQAATFTVDAWPDRTFPSQVRALYADPTTVANVVTYQAILDVANPGHLLLPGMTATASVEVDRRQGALLVPNDALRFAPEGAAAGGPRVWVEHAGKLDPVPVTPGATDGAHTEVSGIAAGTAVVLGTK